MKKGPIVGIFVLAGMALFLMPAIHAAVREANTLFALGIATQNRADPALASARVSEYADRLAPIPGVIHWVGIGAGACCLSAGVAMVFRPERSKA